METNTLEHVDIAPLSHAEIVCDELANARRELRPISRHRLASLLVSKTGLPLKEALDVVDVYCDKHAPAVPTYLGREFVIGWLKWVAVVNVLLAIGCFAYGRREYLDHKQPWPIWCIGVLICGLAVMSWLKSLESEVKKVVAESSEGVKLPPPTFRA